MQANCEMCWFVLGIHCSTGFEMKTFACSELLANLSHWGTGSLTVFPLVFFTTLYLNLHHHPSTRLSSYPPLSLFIFHSSSSKLLVIFTFSFSLPFKLFCIHFYPTSKVYLAQIYQTWHWEKKLGPPLLSVSNACSCLTSEDGCQAMQSQTLCSAGVCLWSLLTNSNVLFLSGGDLG